MKKRKFIKQLKKEKNPILLDKNLLFIEYPFIIIVILMSCLLMYKLTDVIIVESYLGFVVSGLMFALAIPYICVELAIDLKVNKMYKKHLKGEDYNNCCKRLNKSIIIISVIFGIIGTLIVIDFLYSTITGNKPIISIKDKTGTTEYAEKYRGALYDYYKFDDGRTYLKFSLTPFEDPYFVKMAGEDVFLKRTEIIEDKVYLGVPRNFEKADSSHINTRYSALNMSNIESADVYQYKDGKINLVISKSNVHIKNSEVEAALDATIAAFDTYLSDYISWEDQIIQTIGEERKVGILSFTIDYKDMGLGKYYCYMWLYSADGQYVINSFDVDAELIDDWKKLGEIIEDTIEFVED